MKEKIIKDWESEHYPLGNLKKKKLLNKTKDEIISILDSMTSWKSLKGIANESFVSCYLCGKYIKESEIIPDETYPVCDECEAKLEFE